MTDETKRFFGLILVVIGILMLVFTGLCTVSVLLFLLQSYSVNANDLLMIVVFAGPAALLGWGCYAWGRSLRRSAQ